MNKNNTVFPLLQVLIKPAEIQEIAKRMEYIDTARKFRVEDLLNYWIAAAIYEFKGIRASESECKKSDILAHVDHTTISKKAKVVPFQVFKKIFQIILDHCNRATRRHIKRHFRKILFALDSTTVTTGKNRLPWAPLHGKRAGVKLHVEIDVESRGLNAIEESIAKKHDSQLADRFEIPINAIAVRDRAYLDIGKFDRYTADEQEFVIRLKGNVIRTLIRSLQRIKPEESNVVGDYTCLLGDEKHRSTHRFRVIEIEDKRNHIMRVVTNNLTMSAEQIAEIYKGRWRVELLFRFLKQHLNLTRLFGETENAVYGQLYGALIAYVLLHFMYEESCAKWRYVKLTMIEFIRDLMHGTLPIEAVVQLRQIISRVNIQSSGVIV